MDERWQTICSNFDVHFHDVKRSFRTASIVGMLFAGSMSNCHAQSQNAVQTNDRPLVQIHLHTYGYNPGMRGGHNYWSLAFVGNDELVLGWTTSDDWDAAQKKGYLTPAPSHLHAVVLNARTGQKRNRSRLAGIHLLREHTSGRERKLLDMYWEVDSSPFTRLRFGSRTTFVTFWPLRRKRVLPQQAIFFHRQRLGERTKTERDESRIVCARRNLVKGSPWGSLQ
jgi:hypothetical protein